MRKTIILFLALSAAVLIAGCCQMETMPPVAQQPPVVVPETPPPPPPPEPPKPPEVKEIYLDPIFFDYNKFDLRSGDQQILANNIAKLKENPDAKIKIEGHCDERGTVEYNLALGEKRAKAAMQFLVDKGIDPGRMSIVSYGKERPLDPGHDEKAWAKNRRAEFVIVTQQ
ncbi:MAG: peptidoglycan-associated lipoprotein Pal [Candidatus Zixiibacteriota bacterium]